MGSIWEFIESQEPSRRPVLLPFESWTWHEAYGWVNNDDDVAMDTEAKMLERIVELRHVLGAAAPIVDLYMLELERSDPPTELAEFYEWKQGNDS